MKEQGKEGQIIFRPFLFGKLSAEEIYSLKPGSKVQCLFDVGIWNDAGCPLLLSRNLSG